MTGGAGEAICICDCDSGTERRSELGFEGVSDDVEVGKEGKVDGARPGERASNTEEDVDGDVVAIDAELKLDINGEETLGVGSWIRVVWLWYIVSEGEGIRVLRYRLSGTRSSDVRAEKCRRSSLDDASTARTSAQM